MTTGFQFHEQLGKMKYLGPVINILLMNDGSCIEDAEHEAETYRY